MKSSLEALAKQHLGWIICLCLTGCAMNKAIVNISVVDRATLMPITGSRAIDGRNNQLFAIAPDAIILYQRNGDRLLLPLVLETRCANIYYKLVAIDKWTSVSTPDHLASNVVVFEVDNNKENCAQVNNSAK